MATLAGMTPAQSIGRRVGSAARAITTTLAGRSAQIAARIKPNVLTVGGLGCIDTGAFTANHIAGWIVTGLSLLLLDWKLADE